MVLLRIYQNTFYYVTRALYLSSYRVLREYNGALFAWL